MQQREKTFEYSEREITLSKTLGREAPSVKQRERESLAEREEHLTVLRGRYS